jgi:hypothetical protein
VLALWGCWPPAATPRRRALACRRSATSARCARSAATRAALWCVALRVHYRAGGAPAAVAVNDENTFRV